MTTETTNHDLLIATDKTPHVCRSEPNADTCVDKKTQIPFRFNNWHYPKQGLRVQGWNRNTRNTFIDGGRVFLQTGRIDAASHSDHPRTDLEGVTSLFFRGDTQGAKGSPDLIKEERSVMRTTDPTWHNCKPPNGPMNCKGTVQIDLDALAADRALRDQILKKCTITSFRGTCSHGRAAPNGGQLEVVKSTGFAPEMLTFTTTRQDTSVAPPGGAKCQFPGTHAKWKAVYGAKVIQEAQGVDQFVVRVPGFSTPNLTGVIPAVAWMIRMMRGPQYLTISAEGCAGPASTMVRCYPNGKLAVDFTSEKAKFQAAFQKVKDILEFVKYMGALLNGGSVGKMTFELIPDGSTLAFECEFKERKNHLVGVAWKATAGFNPLAKLDFAWPVPLPTFLGPFAWVGKTAQWIAEAAGLEGRLTVGFFFQFIVVGTFERSEEGVYTPAMEPAITFTPNMQLTLTKGSKQDPSHKITIMLGIEFGLKLQIVSAQTGDSLLQGKLTGSIQIGFTIDYFKKGSGTSKLVDYKPDWARWPADPNGKELTTFNWL